MHRFVRGLAALLCLVALLGGVPFALARFVGRPWPHPFPAIDTIWASIRAGDISDQTVIKALAILIWIAWARLALSIVIEIGARLSGSVTPHVIGLGSAQQWAAGLVAAVTLMIGVAPRDIAAAATVGPRPISAGLLQADPVRPVMAAPAQFEFALESATSGAVVTRPTVVPMMATHTVERHESFWSIADDELGDGARWREIVELNRGVEVAPGVVFDGTAGRLLPGWVLMIPGSPTDAGIPTTPGVAPDSVIVPESVTVPEPDEAVVPRTVVVDRGDTLSEIAAEQLGDASQWPALFEANRGREFDGRTFDDPNLILTGWELIVPTVFDPPSTAVIDSGSPVVAPPDVASVPEPTTTPDNPIDTVQPEIAGLDDAPVESPVESPGAGAPGAVIALPTLTVTPSLVTPTVVTPSLVTPTVVTPSLVTPTVSERPTFAAPAAAPAAAPVAVANDGSDQDLNNRALPIGLGAGLLLSSGVLAAVASRRRRRLRSASVNARLAVPSAEATATEAVLRSIGDGERIARLDIALRAAAGFLVDVAPGNAVLGAIVSRDGAVDLLLTEAVISAPEPWQSVSDHCWRLSADTPMHRLAAAARCVNQPCPAIAHIGTVAVDDGVADLFVDLETLGLLSVDGHPDDAANVVRAMAAGVALSPMSEISHLIASGLDGVVLGHPQSMTAATLDTAIDLAANAIGTTAAMTSASLSTFTLRARHQGGEAWEPAIVFAVTASDTVADTALDADLIGMTSPGGRGLAVVVDRSVANAPWRLIQGDSSWLLQPLGLEVAPIGLSVAELGQVRRLLDEADQMVIETDPGAMASGEPTLDVDPNWGNGGWVETEWPLMVRLLGQVEVVARDGRPVEFERSKALELVAWLSQHRERSVRSAARTALWELNVRDATFANVVSDARRALARLVPTVDNQEWIGRTLTEQLPLHHDVTTDAEQLSLRLAHARQQVSIDAIATLRPGLDLVRDLPFSGTSYLWPDTEGITSQLTLLVTSASAVLAGHYLAIGDIDGVFWATGRGLHVLAGHEELIGLRMRAHARNGDLAGVRLEWESYERSLISDTFSDAEPSPKIASLRRELLAGSMLIS